MNYCVLVKISKHKASFWYQTEGSSYAPLVIKESHEVPLYFYVCGNDYIFGTVAMDRFFSNDPNAFGNYFEIVTDPTKHFSIYGIQKPVKQLLYYGIEQYLSHFINTVLYKSESIESYRQNFPLRFIFDNDIEDKEKTLIESLFKEAGYDNVERVIFQEALMEILCTNGIINFNKSVLLLTGIDNNLYLELYKSSKESITAFAMLPGLGADPRVKILAEEILEDVLALHPYLSLNKENEITGLLSYAAGLIDKDLPIIKGDAILSDGKSYSFEVRKRKLYDRLNYIAKDGLLFQGINTLLETNGISIQNTVMLLVGREINTSYFENKLLSTYPSVLGVDTAHSVETMKLIFLKVAQAKYSLQKNVNSPCLQQEKQQPKLPSTGVSPTPVIKAPPPSKPLTMVPPPPPQPVPKMPPPPQPKPVVKVAVAPPPPPPPLKTAAKVTVAPPPPLKTAAKVTVAPPPPPPPLKTVAKVTVAPPPPPPLPKK